MAGPWEKFAPQAQQQSAPAASKPWERFAQPQPQQNVIATTDNGGKIYKMSDGSMAYADSGFSTTDQAQISQLMEGSTPVEVQQPGIDQATIAQHPIAARGAKFVEGTPFVGSYADEAIGAVFGGDAKEGFRATSDAMTRENPNESMALNLAGGVAGSIPIAVAAGPSLIASAPTSLAGKTVLGAGVGAAAGGVEGAIYGSGQGDGSERLENAKTQGAFGAGAGGVFGAGAPLVGSAFRQLVSKFKGSDIGVIAKELDITPDAARVIRAALDAGDPDSAMVALDRAGAGAMLADAGQPARELLDASVSAGGPAGRVARDAIEDRAAKSHGLMTDSLDAYLGKPTGFNEIRSGIRQGSQVARSTAYDAAYAAPINYAEGAGRRIEGLMQRVPQSAINKANDLMKLAGDESAQIIAKVGDNGRVVYETLPDVRQLDYITRALNDVAENANAQGKLGGTTAVGMATSKLSGQIRTALKAAVPEYGTALDVASDAIGQVRATDLGYDLLKAKTTRELVSEGVRGASAAEKAATKAGVRSYIDDTLSRVSKTISDPNTDAREAMKLVKDLSSRANATKLRLLLGKDAADGLLNEIDNAAIALDLRAAIAQNSKTAIRQSIQSGVDEVTQPGMVSALAQGEPVNAAKRFVQALTGATPEAEQLRKMGIYEEIASTLTNTRGGRAKAALHHIQSAMDGQALTDRQAAFIGNVIATTSAATGSLSTSRALANP